MTLYGVYESLAFILTYLFMQVLRMHLQKVNCNLTQRKLAMTAIRDTLLI